MVADRIGPRCERPPGSRCPACRLLDHGSRSPANLTSSFGSSQRGRFLLCWMPDSWDRRLICDSSCRLSTRHPFPLSNRSPIDALRMTRLMPKTRLVLKTRKIGSILASTWVPTGLLPLGECFAKSQASIEREALRVIRGDWQLSVRKPLGRR